MMLVALYDALNNVLLLKTAITFAAAAAVLRFPCAPVSVTGVSVVSGTAQGTPTGTQSVTPDYCYRMINNARPTDMRRSEDTNIFSIAIAAVAVAPAFGTTPQAVATADGWDSAFTVNTNCTAYAVAKVAGSAIPTAAQLKAGTAALASSQVVIAATGPGALGLRPVDFPVADLHFLLNNNIGDSAVFSLFAQQRLPATGLAFRVFGATVDPDTFYSGNVSAGDIEEVPVVLQPSSLTVVTYKPDGNDSFIASGRQQRISRLYDLSAGAWMLDSSGVQPYNVWYNDVPPIFTGGVSTVYAVPMGTPAVPIALRPLFQSQDQAQLVMSVVSGLPAGLSIDANGQIIGTASVGGIYHPVIRAMDVAQATGDGSFALIVGSLSVPDLFNMDYREAAAIILASFLVPVILFSDSDGPPNIVLSQDPLATSPANLNSTVTLTVSRTPAGQLPRYGLRDHSFQAIPRSVNGHIDMKHPLGD